MIVLVWIALNISYYGLFLWQLPFVLQEEKDFTVNVYLLLALSALSQFPGYGASIWLVERIGRKRTLTLFLALVGASALTFALADTQAVFIASLFFVGFFNLGAWGAVYPVHGGALPHSPPLVRIRNGGRLRQGRRDRRPVPLRRADRPERETTVWSLVFGRWLVMVAGAVATLFGRGNA